MRVMLELAPRLESELDRPGNAELFRDLEMPLVPVLGSVAMAELQSRQDTGELATPALLGPSRVVALPGWMDTLAQGAPVGGRDSFPVAAVGHNPDGEVGILAFDVRNHLLLDPDRMDALVLTVDALKRTLLAAKSIAYPVPDAGHASGIHFVGVIERLGTSVALDSGRRPSTANNSTLPSTSTEHARGRLSMVRPVTTDEHWMIAQ